MRKIFEIKGRVCERGRCVLFCVRGQSLVEYTALVLLVMTAMVVMGPYIIGSWNAWVKGSEDAVEDSFEEQFQTASPATTSVVSCDCGEWQLTATCGATYDDTTCRDSEYIYTRSCMPFGCTPTEEAPFPIAGITPLRTAVAQCVDAAADCCSLWRSTGLCDSNADPQCSQGHMLEDRLCGPDETRQLRCSEGVVNACICSPSDGRVGDQYGAICSQAGDVQDDMGLSGIGSLFYTLVDSCTGTKCEQLCADGFISQNGDCVCPDGAPFNPATGRCMRRVYCVTTSTNQTYTASSTTVHQPWGFYTKGDTYFAGVMSRYYRRTVFDIDRVFEFKFCRIGAPPVISSDPTQGTVYFQQNVPIATINSGVLHAQLMNPSEGCIANTDLSTSARQSFGLECSGGYINRWSTLSDASHLNMNRAGTISCCAAPLSGTSCVTSDANPCALSVLRWAIGPSGYFCAPWQSGNSWTSVRDGHGIDCSPGYLNGIRTDMQVDGMYFDDRFQYRCCYPLNWGVAARTGSPHTCGFPTQTRCEPPGWTTTQYFIE